MFTVTIRSASRVIQKEYQNKVLISRALADAGIKQNKPCGGNGLCGKCQVIANGKPVLACVTEIDSDTQIDYITHAAEVQGITGGSTAEFVKNPLVSDGYGAAIDVGTTTIAAYIYSFPDGKCVKSAALPNPQAQFGADVISRIDHYSRGGGDALKRCAWEQIQAITEGYPIKYYVLCGNTAMLHLLAGLDPSGIAASPFQPETLFGTERGNCYYIPCISAYVGADITAAILASGMKKDRCSLLVDIGTNGEMALWNEGRLTCCSTAAGPCFEGAEISCGVPAGAGAVNQVETDGSSLRYSTIGGAPSTGLCGTGLIDAVACMKKLSAIDESGYLEQPFEIAGSGIFLAPEDIRKVQLAKSAVRAGIETLLTVSGVTYRDIESFYIAGGFGSYINQESAAEIGLIPPELLPCAKAIGNAAGNGASMILQSLACKDEAEETAATAEVVELSSNKSFMDNYIEYMMF